MAVNISLEDLLESGAHFGHQVKRWNPKVKEFVCNFVDFLDEPDVEKVVIEHDVERIQKRLKRGKTPNPAQVHIRLTGKLKEYFDSVQTGLQHHLGYRFWVRGHWRHFRSERYKHRLGQKEWIKPFIKGNGILIKKEYDIQKTIISNHLSSIT